MNRTAWTTTIAGLLSLLACWFVTAQVARSGETTSAPTSATTTSAPASKPATFRVASYNINYGVRDARSIAQAITILRKSDADLIAIQEGSSELRLTLARDLKKEYPHQVLKPGDGAGGFALLSRRPVKNVQMLPKVAGGYFRTMFADVELGTPGLTVRVGNVHLMPTLLQGKNMAADLALLQKMEAVRVRETTAILKKLPKDKPAILLGDFNTIETLTVHGLLTKQGLIDSARQAFPPPKTPPITWHWPTPSGTEWTFRIDYIFHTGHFRTTDHQVFAEGPSDHYLLVSQLEQVPEATSQEKHR